MFPRLTVNSSIISTLKPFVLIGINFLGTLSSISVAELVLTVPTLTVLYGVELKIRCPGS